MILVCRDKITRFPVVCPVDACGSPLAATSIRRLSRIHQSRQVIGVSHVNNACNAGVADREKETQVKFQRTGFFLVPAYASATHMIQGISIHESCLHASTHPQDSQYESSRNLVTQTRQVRKKHGWKFRRQTSFFCRIASNIGHQGPQVAAAL